MSASLVGSEMCIRDRLCSLRSCRSPKHGVIPTFGPGSLQANPSVRRAPLPVATSRRGRRPGRRRVPKDG
eukprot:6632637-Alexandrium_andersonii.AAC.1